VRGYSVDYSGLRSRHQNDTAPTPPPELLAFMSVALAPELSFFLAPAPDPASGGFHTLIFCSLGVPQLNRKCIKSSAQS